MSVPEITAIVVSWNVREALLECLTRLFHARGVSLYAIVVDNASTDGTADAIASRFPNVRLVRNTKNYGFAAAVNQGIAGATGDILLLNPDVMVDLDALEQLEGALQRHERVGIVGGRLRYPDGTAQPSVKRFPDAYDLFLVLSKVPNIAPSLTRRYNGLDVDYEREQVVDQVMGSFFLIRRKTLNDVGLFDEQFFLWFEEVDFCKRAKLRGWDTLYTPSATAIHERNASFRQQAATWKQRVLRQSMRHYARKHLGRFTAAMLSPAFFLSALTAPFIDRLRLVKPDRAKDL